MRTWKRLIGTALLAGGVLGVASERGWAQCSKSEQCSPEKGAKGLTEGQCKPTSEKSSKKRITERGTIQSVDAKDLRFSIVDSRKAEVNVCWDASTRFLEHRKAVTASELKPGERVRIVGEKQGDLFRAAEIRVFPQHVATTTGQYSALEPTPPPQGYDW